MATTTTREPLYGSTPSVDGSNAGDVEAGRNILEAIWRRSNGRRHALVGLTAVLGIGALVGAAQRFGGGGATGLGAKDLRTVEFTVDLGCMSEKVMEKVPIADFFDYDITGVGVVFRGDDPDCEFGGASRDCGRLDLVRDGYSMKWKGTKTVRADEEYAFTLTNSKGDSFAELGHNRRFPKVEPLADSSCLERVAAGGGTYLNRVVSKDSQPATGGGYKISFPFGGCRFGGCEVTIKLTAVVGPNSGSADNVYAVEERFARSEPWKPYKGHFSIVSSGEYNTWGLDTQDGTLKWTRNADFNQITDDNWVQVSNNARHKSNPPDGPAVDFDVGYKKVYCVTKSVEKAGGRIWARNVDGSGDWEISGSYSTSRLVQVTIGRTHLWGVNGVNNLYKCRDPCVAGSTWDYEGASVKQIEVGDEDAFIVKTGGKTLQRNSADGTKGWTNVPLPSTITAIDQVAVGATSLWILDTSGGIHACNLPCAGGAAITAVPGAPKNIISIDSGKVIHD